ncbi:MAG: hypothetical protein ABIR28_12195 [Vicinamibacteria bacterium]
MKHWASSRFWALYEDLPSPVRIIADKNFDLLKADPRHASLHLKRIGAVWSVRVGDRYRALGHDVPGGVQWFWIGSHAEYDRLIG